MLGLQHHTLRQLCESIEPAVLPAHQPDRPVLGQRLQCVVPPDLPARVTRLPCLGEATVAVFECLGCAGGQDHEPELGSEEVAQCNGCLAR